MATRTKKEKKQVWYFEKSLFRKIGKQALIKKKWRLEVFAKDSKLAIGSKTNDRDNTNRLTLLGMISDDV